jgi:ubiquinone/menaquinone biosynthesis C-methylase UbiE
VDVAGTGVPAVGLPVPEAIAWVPTPAERVAWLDADIGNPLVDIHHPIPRINAQLSTNRPAPINNSQPRRDCGKKEPNQPISRIITKRPGGLFGDTLFSPSGRRRLSLQSISFDRAAGYYDETRRLPEEIGDQIAASAAGLLPAGARVLEIGIGTGRISIPLLRRGLRVSGVDLSILMMKRLVAKLADATALPALIQADATRLPLRPACYQAVFAVHVFHLIAGWQQAAGEIKRVLAPQGALFIGQSRRDLDSPLAKIREQWSRMIGDLVVKEPRPGVRDTEELDAYLRALGAQIRTWDAAQWQTLTSLEETIRQLEAGVYSSTWRLPAETLHTCAASLRAWAREQYGDLDRPLRNSMRFTWKLAQWAE